MSPLDLTQSRPSTQKYEDQIESLQKQVMEQSMTMSMISSIAPDDFHNEEDVFVNPIFEVECNWNEREYELAQLGFAKWRQHQVSDFSDISRRLVLIVPFTVHLLKRRLVGQCRVFEGSQRHFGGIEETSSVPVCLADRHLVLTSASRYNDMDTHQLIFQGTHFQIL